MVGVITLIIGIFIGAILGLLAISLCYSAKSYSDEYEGIHKYRGFEFVSTEQLEKSFGEDRNEAILKLPKRATKGSAGYDCYAPVDIYLGPGNDIKIPTGIKSYMRNGEMLMAFPRSGLGFKYYCRLANTIGIIDKDYYNNPDNEGHIFVKLRNEGDEPLIIRRGEAMCQFIFTPFLLADNDNFTDGNDRIGGFGSTDDAD